MSWQQEFLMTWNDGLNLLLDALLHIWMTGHLD